MFDYNNDGRVDEDDETVFRCLSTTGGSSSCCDNVVDNGFVGIVFGGVTINGDRTISQIGTKDLPGVVFYGAAAGHRAGAMGGMAADRVAQRRCARGGYHHDGHDRCAAADVEHRHHCRRGEPTGGAGDH